MLDHLSERARNPSRIAGSFPLIGSVLETVIDALVVTFELLDLLYITGIVVGLGLALGVTWLVAHFSGAGDLNMDLLVLLSFIFSIIGMVIQIAVQAPRR